MKKLFIVANWKSNKNIEETEEWLHSFSEGLKREGVKVEGKKIIIAPSFTSLEHAHYCAENLKLPVEFAAQNISPYDEGAYTGEVNGKQIKELADYVIVGHSERRRHFGEAEETIAKKLSLSVKYHLIPILCISDLSQLQSVAHNLQPNKLLIAYEPLFAIGSGNPDTAENADNMAAQIKKKLGDSPVLYGGSLNAKNVRGFLKTPHINGVLVGGASLRPLDFLAIIKHA